MASVPPSDKKPKASATSHPTGFPKSSGTDGYGVGGGRSTGAAVGGGVAPSSPGRSGSGAGDLAGSGRSGGSSDSRGDKQSSSSTSQTCLAGQMGAVYFFDEALDAAHLQVCPLSVFIEYVVRRPGSRRASGMPVRAWNRFHVNASTLSIIWLLVFLNYAQYLHPPSSTNTCAGHLRAWAQLYIFL